MKVYSKLVEVKTWGPMKLHPVKTILEEAVRESGIGKGILWASVKGATPALLVLERSLEEALLNAVKKLIPFTGWRHGNAYAHLVSTTLSTCLAIPVENGKLLLDDVYEIYLLETRPVYNHRRSIAISIHGE